MLSAGGWNLGVTCSVTHVTGNVNKTPVVDAEVAAPSERKAQQEYFAFDDLRSDKL